MKRIKIMLLLVVPLILTGCASTLKCEIETKNYNSTIKIKFEEDKPLTYKYKDEMLYSNSLDTDAELYYHSQYSKYNYLINDGFAKITNSATNVKTKIEYNFEENQSQGESTLLISRHDTMKGARSKIESSGYKCK